MTTIDHPDTSVVLLELDPRDLAEHPANLRKAKGDLAGLTASIDQRGVLQPIVVSKLDDGWRIHFGHRRTAAAIAAGLDRVPVVQIPGDGSDGDVIDMLAENLHRKDLTVAEEADAYLQLQAAGLDVPTIAKASGVDDTRVRHGLTIAGSKTVDRATEVHPVTLEQAATLAELEAAGEDEAIEDLLRCLEKEPEYFDHDLSAQRQEIEARKRRDEAKADLEANGIRILTAEEYSKVTWRFQAGHATALSDIKGTGKGAMTPAAHKKCPGHAAHIGSDHTGEAKISYYCLDPLDYAHAPLHAGKPATTAGPDTRTDKQREKDKAERRAAIENNKAWRAATPVRLEFVDGLMKRKTAPKGMLRAAVETVAGSIHWAQGGTEDLLKRFTGQSGGTGYWTTEGAAGKLARKGTDAQLPLALFAVMAAAVEHDFDAANRPYESTDPRHKRYLELLRDAGYTLAPVEELITGKPKTAKAAAG